MNILILGNGFIGQKIGIDLVNNGNLVTILARSDLDYTNQNILLAYLSNNNYVYDYIINASGYTGIPNVDAAEDDKETCWKFNVEVPSTIISAAERAAIPVIHISSGCIYNGYVKHWTENDVPNFGLFNPNSSFYSKTKHAAETILAGRNAVVLRIRIPFCGDKTPRNYFSKLLGYDQLISTSNSVTCVEDLCDFISSVVLKQEKPPVGIWNVVNEGTLTAKQVIDCLAKYGITNPNHRFIDVTQLETKAKRSNCILSTEKLKTNLRQLPDVLESLEKCVSIFAGVKANVNDG